MLTNQWCDFMIWPGGNQTNPVIFLHSARKNPFLIFHVARTNEQEGERSRNFCHFNKWHAYGKLSKQKVTNSIIWWFVVGRVHFSVWTCGSFRDCFSHKIRKKNSFKFQRVTKVASLLLIPATLNDKSNNKKTLEETVNCCSLSFLQNSILPKF